MGKSFRLMLESEQRRIRVKKRFLIPFVIIVTVLLVVSCKKKDAQGQNGPVVTVAQEKTTEPKTLDKEIPLITVNESLIEESEEKDIDRNEDTVVEEEGERKPISFVYRGGTVLLRSNFHSDNGEIKTNISEEDAKDFVSRLLSENPEFLDKYSVSFEEDVVMLSYSADTTEDELSSLWDKVRDLMDRINAEKEEASPLLVSSDSPVDTLEKSEEVITTLPSDTVETSIENEDGEKETDVLAESPVIEEVIEENIPTPLTNAGKLIDKFSVSLSFSAKYNSGFDSDIKAMFDVSVIPSLRIGVAGGYEVKGYIPLSLRLRYDIPILDGLYSFLDCGWRFGLKENKGGVVLSIGVGYEHEILDGFFVFGEADGQLSFGEDFKFMPSIVVGGRYRF